MTFPNTGETPTKKGPSSSGRQEEPQFHEQKDRYEPPDAVRLGAIAEVSHGEGPVRESVASYWQRR